MRGVARIIIFFLHASREEKFQGVEGELCAIVPDFQRRKKTKTKNLRSREEDLPMKTTKLIGQPGQGGRGSESKRRGSSHSILIVGIPAEEKLVGARTGSEIHTSEGRFAIRRRLSRNEGRGG